MSFHEMLERGVVVTAQGRMDGEWNREQGAGLSLSLPLLHGILFKILRAYNTLSVPSVSTV